MANGWNLVEFEKQRTPDEWRGTGIQLLGIGLIVVGVIGWIIWVVASAAGWIDWDLAELFAMLSLIMLCGAAECCEGAWRIVQGRPSVWGTRAIVLAMFALFAFLAVTAIRDGIDPWAMGD